MAKKNEPLLGSGGKVASIGTGRIILAAVDRAVSNRWDDALARAADTEGSLDERVDAIRKSFLRELTAVGAATGGTAALPVIGTATALGLTAAELAWTATRTTDMILTVAAVYGHTDATEAERKTWVLSMLAFDRDAAEHFGRIAAEYGGTVAASRSLSVDLVERINSRLGRLILARYGAGRSMLIFGKLLPFGVGAIIGGAANRHRVNTVMRRSVAFFTEITSWKAIAPPHIPPPPAIGTTGAPTNGTRRGGVVNTIRGVLPGGSSPA